MNAHDLPATLAADTAPAVATSSAALMLDSGTLDRLMRVADIMATGRATVPKHLQGNPGDCLAVAMQAVRWNMDPFVVAQKTHLVGGTLGYEAQLVNAVIQSSGAIEGRFHYEYRGEGDSLECRVGAVIRGESEITWNEWLALKSVTTKNSPLWKTNPRQQLGYLQVKYWSRLYTPGAILGVYTPEELASVDAGEKHMGAAEVVEPPKSATRTNALKSRLVGDKRADSQPIPAVTMPALSEVLVAIESATDADSMAHAKQLGARMADGPDKDQAVEAYKRRVAALKAAAEQHQADPETGEIQRDEWLEGYEAAEAQQ
jgi:hypothetical protein